MGHGSRKMTHFHICFHVLLFCGPSFSGSANSPPPSPPTSQQLIHYTYTSEPTTHIERESSTEPQRTCQTPNTEKNYSKGLITTAIKLAIKLTIKLKT